MRPSVLSELIYHLINCVILTAIVSMFVLWRYRVSVLAAMAGGDKQIVPLPDVAPPAKPPAAPFATPALRWERRREWRVALAYLLATLLSALPLALGGAYVLDAWPIYPSRVFMMALLYTFVCAPMIAATLSLSPARALRGVVLLVAVLTSVVVVGEVLEDLVLGQHIGLAQLAVAPTFLGLLASNMGLLGLFWLATWPHKIRGVAPLTFAALIPFGLAPFMVGRLNAISTGDAGSLRLNATFLLIAVPAGCLGWMRLRQLAAQYQRKRFSDAQLLARTWWLMLMMNVGLQLFSGQHPWAATVFFAFGLLCFAPVSARLLARLRPDSPVPEAPEGRTLLLLRTFGYTARTERLFDRVGARWRAFGPVLLIAAPDVTARTIGPGEYLRWLTGRIDDIFITSARDLSERLARLDLAPDPDGRYRVNAFCCRSNTWQATVAELIGRADAVVMDVRGLTPARHGCEFELQQLAARLHPRRLVLVADRTTDRELLNATFGPHVAQARVISVAGRNISSVFEVLLEAAA